MPLPAFVQRAPDVSLPRAPLKSIVVDAAYDFDPDRSTTGPLGKWPVF